MRRAQQDTIGPDVLMLVRRRLLQHYTNYITMRVVLLANWCTAAHTLCEYMRPRCVRWHLHKHIFAEHLVAHGT